MCWPSSNNADPAPGLGTNAYFFKNNYCENTWVGPQPPARISLNNINIYPNPSSDKIYITKNVDFNLYNMIGDMIISETNKNVLDVSYLIPGIYNLQIIYNENTINKKIIKK